jgi:hypothetical protein
VRREALHITAFALCFLSGCTSLDVIENAPAVAGKCEVRVFQTEAQARKRGEIEELCVISGSSSMSFDHSVEGAIKKHKNRACECGATNVFIQSRSYSGLGVAEVSMIAFRFKHE